MKELIVFPRGKDPVAFDMWPAGFHLQGKGFCCFKGKWRRFHSHKALNKILLDEEVPARISAMALLLS